MMAVVELANRRLHPLGHPSTDEWDRHGVCGAFCRERVGPSQFVALGRGGTAAPISSGQRSAERDGEPEAAVLASPP